MSGVATAIVVGTVGGAMIGAHGAEKAADKQAGAIGTASALSAAAAEEARGDVTGLYDTAREDYLANINRSLSQLQGPNIAAEQFQPYADVGRTALQQQAILAQTDPYADFREYERPKAFEESEAQKFFRERQEQSLLRNQAAIGGLGGGNVRTALQEQAVGIAAQQREQYLREREQGLREYLAERGQFGAEQQQRFANYGTLADTGFNASVNLANLSQQDRINLANLYERKAQALSGLSTGEGTTLANIATGQGTQQANLAQSLGETRAAEIIGKSNAMSSGLSSLALGAGYLLNRPQIPTQTTQTIPAFSSPSVMATTNPYGPYSGFGGSPTIIT